MEPTLLSPRTSCEPGSANNVLAAPAKSGKSVLAAIDMGSGSTKMIVALVDDASRQPLQVLSTKDTRILFVRDLEQSKDGNLSAEILDQAEKVLISYRDTAIEMGAKKVAGISTAVFRNAKNGSDFMDNVRTKIGINMQLVNPSEEGRIGFLTAVASSGNSVDKVIALDSGGSSTQITTMQNDCLNVFEFPWGISKATATMIEEVQKRDRSQTKTANPAKIEDVVALQAIIQKSFQKAPDDLQIKLVNPDLIVVAIGGPFSIFNIAKIATGSSEYTRDQIWAAINKFAGSTDTELAQANFPEPEMVLPKLCLIYSVMDFFKIEKVRYTPTVGSTFGIFISPQFWEASKVK